jgi:nitroreductase
MANTEINELVLKRWSPKAFSSEKIDENVLSSLLGAARLAPSSFNEQPWNFIVATKEKPKDFDTILSCLRADNQSWAKNAPLLIITVAKMFLSKNGNPNPWAWHDLGLSVANLTFQANQNDLYVCEVAGINPEKVREIYNIPFGYQPCTALVIGKLGNPEELSPEIRQKHEKIRKRKSIEEFTHYGKFNVNEIMNEEQTKHFNELKENIKFNNIEEFYNRTINLHK